MSGYAFIELDTTAPQVTWGAVVAHTDAPFSAEYASDEPIANADLVLLDGTVVPLTVDVDAIRGVLPENCAGQAVLRYRDDVANLGTFAVGIVGPAWVKITLEDTAVTPAPISQPSAGTPLRRRRGEPVHDRVTWRSSAVSSSRTVVRARCDSGSAARVTTSQRIARRPGRPGTDGLVLTQWGARVSRVTKDDAVATTVEVISRRPEGPDTEDELILLLL